MLPENFVPPPYPPAPSHYTSSWPGPSLSPSALMALPHLGKRCKVLGCLATIKVREGRRRTRKGASHFLQL